MKVTKFFTTTLVLSLCSVATTALAQETEAPIDTGAEPEEAAEEESSASINADVEVASAYVWRGWNIFGEEQGDQRASVFPSVSAAFGGLSFGYWGAYQLSGDNASDNVDGGVGAEQDLWLGYDGSISDELSYSAFATYYLYPLADEAAAGTSTPMYLEPGAAIGYSTAVDLGLSLSYFRGLQDETKEFSFIYVNPSVGKEIPIGDMSLALGGGLGYKAFTNLPDGVDADGEFDIQVDAGLNIPFDSLYVSPALHASWISYEGVDFGDEVVAWAGVNVGYDLAL